MVAPLKFLVTVALLIPLAAAAQAGFADPTRPGAATMMDGAASTAGPALQSVILPKGGRPVALVDGQEVRVGDKLGEGVVTFIGETQIKIKGPAGVEVLRLTPGVEKTSRRKSRRN
ncbi:MAG: hypothetical protein KGN39_05850 [Betaproteobacteria bacterium]|nr:hypothetical protein [Betaproteobacteria bacterium]